MVSKVVICKVCGRKGRAPQLHWAVGFAWQTLCQRSFDKLSEELCQCQSLCKELYTSRKFGAPWLANLWKSLLGAGHGKTRRTVTMERVHGMLKLRNFVNCKTKMHFWIAWQINMKYLLILPEGVNCLSVQIAREEFRINKYPYS